MNLYTKKWLCIDKKKIVYNLFWLLIQCSFFHEYVKSMYCFYLMYLRAIIFTLVKEMMQPTTLPLVYF